MRETDRSPFFVRYSISAILGILCFICFQYGDVLFGRGSLNTLAISPAAAPYILPRPTGWLSGTILDRFPEGMTADRAFWDRPMVYDPNLLAAHQAMKAGNMPWLNPSLALGAPLFANGVDASFSLGSLLMLPLDDAYWDYVYLLLYALSLWAVFHVFSTYYKCSRTASFVGALVYGASGLFVPQLSYMGEVFNVHAFTWGVFFIERLLSATSKRKFLTSALGLVVALCQAVYSGMPEGSVAVFISLAFLLVARGILTGRLVTLAPGNRPLLSYSFLSWTTGIFGCALLLSAPYLVTLFHYSTLMPHDHLVGKYTIPAQLLPGIFLPYFHGWPLQQFFDSTLDSRLNVVFVGLLPLLFFIGALSTVKRLPRQKDTVFWFCVVLFYLSQSFSIASFNLNIVGSLPVLEQVFFFRFFAPLCVFALAALTVACTEKVLSIANPRNLRVSALSSWLLLVLVYFYIEQSSREVLAFSRSDVTANAFRDWNYPHLMVIGFFALYLTAASFGPTFWPRARYLWECRKIAFLTLAFLAVNTHYSKSFFPRQSAAAPVPFIQFLQNAMLTEGPFRIYSDALFFPGTASSYGLQDIRHMNPVVPSNFMAFVNALFGDLAKDRVSWERFERLSTGQTEAFSHPAFDILNVRYFVFPASTRPLPRGKRFDEVFRDKQAVIIANRDAKPRAWIPDTVVVLGSTADVLKETELYPGRAERTAFVTDPRAADVTASTSGNDTVELVEQNGSGSVLRVNLTTSRLVVISDLYHEGYTARKGKESLPIIIVDGGLIGVIAPPGSYELTVRYAPPHVNVSAALLVLGLILALGAAVLTLRGKVPCCKVSAN